MPDSHNRSVTPSLVHFHDGASPSPLGDLEAGGPREESGPDGDSRSGHPAHAPAREVVEYMNNEEKKEGSEVREQNHFRFVPGGHAAEETAGAEAGAERQSADSERDGTNMHVPSSVGFADTVIDVAESKSNANKGGAAPQLHRVKSVSHWQDSRISVEMHLALYIEDLMMLAPGVASEKPAAAAPPKGAHELDTAPTPDTEPSSQSSALGSAVRNVDVPVEFDEDAEPDITLQHVLAGVDYLLKTRIVGAAGPDAVQQQQQDGQLIAEGDEEEEEDENPLDKPGHHDAKDDDGAPAVDPASRMPAPLVEAPHALVSAGVSSTASEAPFKPASKPTSRNGNPFFHFVSLDLALCDDLVTALCYHMRRAEQKWSLRPKASAEAIKALELFEAFFTYVYSFRCCVAARSTAYLRASLKVSRHMRSSSQAHRRLVVRLLLMLTKECPRIERWDELVDNPDEMPRVREILTSSEMRKFQKRLAGHNKADMEREASVTSFAVSRTGKSDLARGGGGGGGGGGNHALLQQSFPAFYSTRHQQLLPPKGALFDCEPHRLTMMFKTDAEKGLHEDEIEERQKMYGKNVLPPPHQASFLSLLWAQLKDFIIGVLLAAAIVSLAIEDWEAAGVLFVVVLVNVTIGLVQEKRSHDALKALNSFAIPQATVIRDGTQAVIPASELVPGDAVILSEGDNIPADVRIVQVAQLFTIEAILTGESLPVLKSTAAIKVRGRRFLPVGDRVNMAFMSTLVSKGRATGIVVNTGATTEVGRIYSALSSSSEEAAPTPLQRKLATLGKWLVGVSILACGAVIAIGLGRGYGTDIITIGISLAVSVIPEGLVTVVTLTQALGTQRMAKQKAIVRNLPAIETLGAVTTIASDKTGTLTEGKMKTESMWVVAEGAPATSANSKAGGHTIRFVTAGKNAAATVPVKAPVQLPQQAALAVAESVGVDQASSSSAVPVSVAPVVAAGSVTGLLNETISIQSASQLPVPLLWHNLVCSMNNNATVKVQEVLGADGKATGAEEEVLVGDATEVALLRATQQAYAGVQYWTSTYGLKRVLEFAFDSDRKRMSVILALPPTQNNSASSADEFVGVRRPADATHILLSKGAPEAVLNRAESHLTCSPSSSSSSSSSVHEVTKLSEEVERRIEEEGSLMAGKGMRVLATAFRFLTQSQVDKFHADQQAANVEAEAMASAGNKAEGGVQGPSIADISCAEAESDLVFIGLAGIMDPPRVEVADSIRRAHIAGIRVCMITGDHYDTALAIAKQIGIFQEDRQDRAMNGDALAVLTEEQLAALQPFPVVFSRVSPDNKLKLVKSLQRRDEIVAMTGDGVNDSPAIKQADVGIAMGLGGTEVTRQAADIILSDDNFSTIVLSVGEGRRIYDNIVKFLVYLLTCNGAEVWVMLFAVILDMPVPFLSLMLLWANIFVDIPPSLSLGLEVGEVDAMNRPPRKADATILSLRDCVIIALDSGFMAVMLLVNFYMEYETRDKPLGEARTFAFMLLAMLHLVHSFESRSLTESMLRRDIFSANPTLAGAFVLSVAFLVLGCYCPGLNHVLELEPLEGTEWGIIFINLAIHLTFVEMRKLVLRLWQARQDARRRAELDMAAQDGQEHTDKVELVVMPDTRRQHA